MKWNNNCNIKKNSIKLQNNRSVKNNLEFIVRIKNIDVLQNNYKSSGISVTTNNQITT